MHFKVDFVPDPVVEQDASDEDHGPLPRNQRNQNCEGQSFDWCLVHVQTNFFVFTRRYRLIGKDFRVMFVVSNGMRFENSVERFTQIGDSAATMHQMLMHLVLGEGHNHHCDYGVQNPGKDNAEFQNLHPLRCR